MAAEDAAAIYSLLHDSGIRCWVMGGWGVDALLGTQTRPHHDLDLLVAVADLPLLHTVMATAGFAERTIWSTENEWVVVDGSDWPTAFVLSDERGREVDVHAIELDPAGRPTPRCLVPWQFPEETLEGRGVIGATPVECLSARAQAAVHTGYVLPTEHLTDLHRLRQLEEP
jgi:lincosamide nucleotidyltransferase A/C/D/E